MIGKVIAIAGMKIEVLADEGEHWQCRNLTTGSPLTMKKAILDRAIRLGQAHFVEERDEE